MSAKDSFTGLNKNLIGVLYPMKRDGDGTAWVREDQETAFEAPLTQATMDLAQNWQSPFESAGVESRFPALAQLAQSGAFQGVLQALGGRVSDENKNSKAFIDDVQSKAKLLVGRTGQTALNSMQVFSGAPPTKIQITAFLRAFKDPWTEVEEPIKLLQEWHAPQYLAPDGVLAEFINSGADLLSLMPSLTPKVLGFTYKGRIFQPMVCESISDPLDAPIDKNGHRISASIQITLCSLTAWDKKGWQNTYPAEYR
jgi:hypothetical protein